MQQDAFKVSLVSAPFLVCNENRDKGNLRLPFQRSSHHGGEEVASGREGVLAGTECQWITLHLYSGNRVSRKWSQATMVCLQWFTSPMGLCLLSCTSCPNSSPGWEPCIQTSAYGGHFILNHKDSMLPIPSSDIKIQDLLYWYLSKNMERKEFACGQSITYLEG